ncbi:MAG: DUF3854 domain-containing protein [Candidatus Riflebacteria bacterium]|nr:DUF3854 domain-containing protein [Candidatus Riflebacteria bacterium]
MTSIEKKFTNRHGVFSHAAITDLKKSGLSDETILAAGLHIFSGDTDQLKRDLGFARMDNHNIMTLADLIAFPYCNEDGSVEFCRYKPVPQIDAEKKYLHPKGAAAIPYILPSVWAVKNKPNKPIWITEGEKKALKVNQSGRHCIALPGIWGFKAGKNSKFEDGSKDLWAQIKAFNWYGRSAFLAFDNDFFTNHQVRSALLELAVKLISMGAVVKFVIWAEGKGIDDYLVSCQDPQKALTELERSSVGFENFVKPEMANEAIRAIGITHLSPVKHAQMVAAISKILKVREALINLQIREIRTEKGCGGIEEFFKRFAQIRAKELVIDRQTGDIMTVGALALEYPDAAETWKKAANKTVIDLKKIVFKPQGCAEDEINLFRGLGLNPADGSCENILRLIDHLCQDDQGLKHWVICWLAYPLKHIGAKMKTTLIVQGTQGSGKSKLFEEVMRKIYKDYFSYVTQEQIEEKFNEWMSQKLFVCGDEVIANKSLGKVKNILKSYITQPTVNIRKMREPARSEENHANFVFLSNEEIPILIDSDDRRTVVLTIDQKAPIELMKGVDMELNNGGDKAFVKFLIEYDVGDFNEHAPAYATEGKDQLKQLCEKAPEKFIRAWQAGELDFPYCCCDKSDLFVAFKLWVEFTGEYGSTAWDGFNNKILTLINRGILAGIRDGKVNIVSDGDPKGNRTSQRAWKVSVSEETLEQWFHGLLDEPSQGYQAKIFRESVEFFKKKVAATKPY